MHSLNIKNRTLFFTLIFTILIFNLFSCDSDSTSPEPESNSRGEIYSHSSLGNYSASQINQILTSAGISGQFDLTYSVETVKIVYQTIDSKGNLTRASGAIMIPVSANNLPMLTMSHGTKTKRDLVASVDPTLLTEGIVGLFAASGGYLACIPDYLGFGESTLLHPYVHAKSNTLAVIDFMRAAKIYCSENNISLNNQLFLGGYSEGGFVTLALQKEIQENYSSDFQVTAAAPMSGPYDLLGTATQLFQQSSYEWPAYIAFIFTAYNDIYSWNRLGDIFNEPYADMMPNLFDGTKTAWEINIQLPNTVTDLLKQEFLTNYLAGNEAEITNAFAENTLLNWRPIAPIRFFHGDADEVVTYQNVLTAIEGLRSAGGTEIELITIVGGTHETAGLPSVLGMMEWFDEFKK